MEGGGGAGEALGMRGVGVELRADESLSKALGLLLVRVLFAVKCKAANLECRGWGGGRKSLPLSVPVLLFATH